MTSDERPPLPAWTRPVLAAFLLAMLIWPTRAQAESPPLHQAVVANDLARVRLLLDQGANPSLADDDLSTPIHEAAREGHLEILRLLLDRGGKPDDADDLGKRPLYLAAIGDHSDCCRLLLGRGAQVNALSLSGYPALHDALSWGKVHAAMVLLDAGADVEWTVSELQETSLMTASRRGPSTVVQALLKRRADPRRRDKQGRTALHYAALGNEPEVATRLLAAGLSSDQDDSTGESAFQLALRLGHRETAAVLLLALQDKNAGLRAASRWGTIGDVQSLLSSGAKATEESLVAACGREQAPDFGAVVSVFGDTEEARAESVEVARSLLHAGARPSIDALCAACQAGNLGIVEILLAEGVNPHQADKTGDYPLLKAAGRGSAALVRMLLDAGAQPDICDSQGFSGVQRMEARMALLEALLQRYGRSRALHPEERVAQAELERMQRDAPFLRQWLGTAQPTREL